MNLSPALLELLAKAILKELNRATVGHCLRVDYLNSEDALELCKKIERMKQTTELDAFVLTKQETVDIFHCQPERAIEIRNRKKTRLCIFIPEGLVDAAASSLTNSFSLLVLELSLSMQL